MTVSPFALGLGAYYRCTRQPCPVAGMYGEHLIGVPGRGYTCECGAPMVETARVEHDSDPDVCAWNVRCDDRVVARFNDPGEANRCARELIGPPVVDR